VIQERWRILTSEHCLILPPSDKESVILYGLLSVKDHMLNVDDDDDDNVDLLNAGKQHSNRKH